MYDVMKEQLQIDCMQREQLKKVNGRKVLGSFLVFTGDVHEHQVEGNQHIHLDDE